MSRALQLLRYRHENLLDDMVAEIGEVLGLPPSEARLRTMEVLDAYPAAFPTTFPRPQVEAVVEFTQPHRLPHMTARLDGILEALGHHPELRTVLDYGGGGGKDAIVYAGAGYRVTYSDLLGTMTPFVAERFRRRGLDIEIVDTRDLGERCFHVVNCLDVLEHIYDVELALADMAARLEVGGHLVCYPAFFNTWNGDHVEKNCGYVTYFARLLEGIGLAPVEGSDPPASNRFLAHALGLRVDDIPIFHSVRRRPPSLGVSAERAALRRDLYRLSRSLSGRRALRSFAVLPLVASLRLVPIPALRRKAREKSRMLLSDVIDNLAIHRLSGQRLEAELQDVPAAD